MQRVIALRERYLTDRQFTLILSFLVGLFAAVAAFILHWLIEEIQLLLTEGFDTETFNWMYLNQPRYYTYSLCHKQQTQPAERP